MKSIIRTVAHGSALALVVAGTNALALELETYSVPLRPERYQGVELLGKDLKLMDDAIVQTDPDLIVVEAEDALEYRWQQYIGVLKAGRSTAESGVIQEYARDLYEYGPQDSEEASGGKYIDFCDVATYSVTVTNPGTYTVWTRHYFTHGGFWCYFHQLNDLRSDRINMPAPREFPVKEWFWKKCATYELTAGTHTFTISQLNAGKRADKFIFARNPDYEPTDLGPESAPKQALAEGWVEFATIRPAALHAWSGIARTLALFRGQITFEASVDDGANWLPLPADNRLPAALRQAPALRFRAKFARAEGRPSPVLKSRRVDFMIAPERLAIIENEHYRLAFDRATGSVVRITNLVTGADLTDPALTTDVVAVFIKKKGEVGRWLEFADAQMTNFAATDRQVTATYTFLDGKIRVDTAVNVIPGMESQWAVKVKNNSDYDVLEVTYPRFERIALDGDADDDVLLWPNLGGMFHPVPARGEIKTGTYPAHLGCGLVGLFDETGGLAVALDDEYVVASGLQVEPQLCRQAVTFFWQKRHRIRAGGGEREYRFLIGVHPGDWHDAADLYRASFYRKFHKPDYPEWVVESDGWVYGGIGVNSGHSQRWYDEIRSSWLNAARFGCDYIQFWGSTFSGACPTYYLPRQECGGEEVFAKFNREWRETGGKIGYYFHGNAVSASFLLWDKYFYTPWSEYPEEVRPPSWEWYLRNRQYPREGIEIAQEPFLEKIKTWEEKKNSAQSCELNDYSHMSFHQGEFLEWLKWWTDRYILDYHTNTMYYDTMAWGADRQEFNPYGDYHGEGDIAPIKMKFLADNIATLRPKVPDFAQLTEGCGDLWNIYCYSLVSGFTKHGTMDVIRYTFPEMAFVEGNANGQWGDQTHKDSLSRAFFMGNKLDCIVRSDFSDDLFRLRQLASPLLARAKFMARIGLDLSNSTIYARTHQLDHEGTTGILITIWNPEGHQDGTVTLDLARYPKPTRFWVIEHGGDPRELTVERHGGSIRAQVPAAINSIIIGLDQVAAPQALATSVRYDGKDVVCRIMNYQNQVVPTTVTVAAPGIKFAQAEIKQDLAPGFQILRFRPENAHELNASALTTVTVAWPGRTRQYLTTCGPLIEDGEFEYYHDFSAVTDVKYSGTASHLIGKSDRELTPAFTPPERKVTDGGYVRREINTLPEYRYRVTLATQGEVGELYVGFERRISYHQKRISFKRQGEDGEWRLHQAEFDGLGKGNIIIKTKPGSHCFVDAIKAEIIGPAGGGQ